MEKDLIGKKVRGFKFDTNINISYNTNMDKVIGEIGIIEAYEEEFKAFKVVFESPFIDYWFYPAYLIEQHLVEEVVFNPQPHYDNVNGSLYKVATDRGWNAYVFDVVKRLERGGKKDPLKQEIEKSIDVLKIWLKELADNKS